MHTHALPIHAHTLSKCIHTLTEIVKLLEGAHEGLRGGGIHEVKMHQVVDAELLQLQHHRAENKKKIPRVSIIHFQEVTADGQKRKSRDTPLIQQLVLM